MFYKRYTDNLKEYDLKRQIWDNEALRQVKMCVIDICLCCNIEMEQIERIFSCDDKFAIERYLLYKSAYSLMEKGKYDCDRCKIVRDFYKKKGKEEKIGSFDTLFSYQYIWGKVITRIEDLIMIEQKKYTTLNEKYGETKVKKVSKFILQLKNINLIKNQLDESLYNCLEKLAHYYHTIGNICPCHSGKYNLAKGDWKNDFYDRIDLFYKGLQNNEKVIHSRNGNLSMEERNSIIEWFSQKNIKKYHLETFLRCDLPSVIPQSDDDLKNYINDIIDMIKERAERLIEA